MKAAWSFEDREFEMPIISQPAEWNTDDGLGWFRGLKNSVPFLIGFYVFAGIVGWLISK